MEIQQESRTVKEPFHAVEVADDRVPVSVMIPTWRRTDDLISTLQRILACRPQPDEVLVHIDFGDQETAPALASSGLPVRVFQAQRHVGPGGGRARLLQEASHEIVASFDDDSYPIDADYFARLVHLFDCLPQAAVLSSRVFHRAEPMRSIENTGAEVLSFIGCGCAYRKSIYLGLRGYLPLPVAYAAEERDLVLQLMGAGRAIVAVDSLRIFHDTDLVHHASPRIVAGTIANTALLAWLHYPVRFLPRAVAQVANSVVYALRRRRWRGIGKGLFLIPQHIARYRHCRQPIPASVLRKYWTQRDQPVPIDVPAWK